jgi:hypothetical protein
LCCLADDSQRTSGLPPSRRGRDHLPPGLIPTPIMASQLPRLIERITAREKVGMRFGSIGLAWWRAHAWENDDGVVESALIADPIWRLSGIGSTDSGFLTVSETGEGWGWDEGSGVSDDRCPLARTLRMRTCHCLPSNIRAHSAMPHASCFMPHDRARQETTGGDAGCQDAAENTSGPDRTRLCFPSNNPKHFTTQQ